MLFLFVTLTTFLWFVNGVWATMFIMFINIMVSGSK